MKRNVRYKIIIALVFLLILAGLIFGFFSSRRGNGEVQSAYDYTRATTVTATKKTTKKADTKDTDTKKTTKKAETTTEKLAEGKKRITVPGTYVTVLNKYQDALKARSNKTALQKAGLSTLLPELYEGNPQDNVGFYLNDFNGDGTMDLIIGVVKGYQHYPYAILDYYTLDNNGDAYSVFQSEPKDYYTVCTKARVLEKATNGDKSTVWYLYGFNSNGMSLTFKEGLLRDKYANEKSPWFLAKDLDGDSANDKHLKKEDGKARQADLDANRKQLTFTKFSAYHPATKAK